MPEPELILTFGNTAPHQADPNNLEAVAVSGSPNPLFMLRLDPLVHNTTVVHVPAETELPRLLRNLQELWPHHSSNPPSWVTIQATDFELPDDVARRYLVAIRTALGMPELLDVPTALLTNAGIDFICVQAAGSASATAVAKWVALTANNSAPVGTDTVLTGEISTAGGGLVRTAATFAHTNGTTTYTLTNTWTANGNDALPVTIAKVGAFNAASVGTLVFETLLNSTATLSAAGDNVPLTWTFTV